MDKVWLKMGLRFKRRREMYRRAMNQATTYEAMSQHGREYYHNRQMHLTCRIMYLSGKPYSHAAFVEATPRTRHAR